MSISEGDIEDRVGELEDLADSIENSLNKFFARMETREWVKLSESFIIYDWESPGNEARYIQRNVRKQYGRWYSSVKPLIQEHSPDRTDDFEEKYDDLKEMIDLDDEVVVPAEPAEACANAIDVFDHQRNIVNNILNRIEIEPLLNSETNELYFGSPDEFFDDEIVSRCFSHFRRGDFQSAIQDAFIVLEERIREQGDLPQDMVGRQLAQEAFEPDSGPLRFGKTGGERAGAKNLYVGAFMTYRNPSSHRIKKDLDRKQSYNILCLVNLLLCSITDESEPSV